MSRRGAEQELATGLQYEPLPSLPEADVDVETPILVGGESYEWAAISNLDLFFTRIYRYWHDKGFVTIILSRVLNICALAFTIAFSGFLLLAVNWGALHAECIVKDTCDITAAALYSHPLQAQGIVWGALSLTYLAIFTLYWLWTVVHFVADLRDLLELKHFVNNKLGISERQVKMMTWSELVHRIVLLQRTTRLCIVRDLTELDIVGRIMRKDNFLIGMLNKGCLALHVPLPLPGMARRRRFMLTKTLEWNLQWCILDHMFDDQFHIRHGFLEDSGALQRRFRALAVANLLLSPFLLIFLVIYFFMRNAEKFYHHPGTIGSRRWTSLAKWRLREFNELPHYVLHRLNASHEAACKYVNQFPNTLVHHVAKFVAFVTGSFAALLLFMTMLDEGLLERPLLGRHVVWWLATLGIVLTVSRTFVSEEPVAHDPEAAMAEIVLHTHHLPRHWRGRAHSAEVQEQFQGLFQYKTLSLLEEMASVLLTPYILYFTLPPCAPAIVEFVRCFTVRVEGVGDICSLAAFDFQRHGNRKYGAPVRCGKAVRSKQGKMEKSFLTFAATYPGWDPSAVGKQMLSNLSQATVAEGSATFLNLNGSTAPPSLVQSALPGVGLRGGQGQHLSMFLHRSGLAGAALTDRLWRQQQEQQMLQQEQQQQFHSSPSWSPPQQQRQQQQQQEVLAQQQAQQRSPLQSPPQAPLQLPLQVQLQQQVLYIPGLTSPPPPQPVMRPCTLYPRGHPLAMSLATATGPRQQQQQQQQYGAQSAAGSIFGQLSASSGSEANLLLATGHEPEDLPSRLQANHALLQGYYEVRDDGVQQRLAHRAHSRSAHLHRSMQL